MSDVPAGMWACPQCTLNNKEAAAKCDACGFDNPAGPVGPWTKYEIPRIEYDHIVALFYKFLPPGREDRLGFAELLKLCRFLNFAHTEQEVAAIFESMDKDRSSSVELPEFCDWVARHRPDPERLYNMTQPEYHAVLFQFAKADAEHGNGDGLMDRDEAIWLARHMHAAPSDVVAGKMFDEIPKTHPGKVTLHEFLSFNANRARGELPPTK